VTDRIGDGAPAGFTLGDRVRWITTGEDGLPLVRYGFVGGVASEHGPVMVMLDGELQGDVIDLDQLEPVTIETVELHLDGADLIDDPDLRSRLVHLWQAEAESAGLAVDAIESLGAGQQLPDQSWSLAALSAGGERYVVRALREGPDSSVVRIRADQLHFGHER
jgi:hypothetical protein